ncbi:MAG: alpha/beta fold hydrolase [Solirubrobacterales bacterium]|jgi:pimeloyl-ACP methyl ester carboxylesterase
MRRGWKIAIGIALGIFVLLCLNAIALNGQTKDAKVNVDGGQIVQAFGGDVQVTDDGPRTGEPIVLLHCYTCSLRWWDQMLPLLAKEHRVIRIDLLGHGGSEKAAAGYGMDDQAGMVASVLAQLGVEHATVVGHSLGFSVATALAERSPGLVTRLVDIDSAPDTGYGSLPFLARVTYTPLLGQGLYRISPDRAIRKSQEKEFAPGYNRASGFENPDQPVEDLRAMTYKSFKKSHEAADDYTGEKPLDERLQPLGKPLLVIFGTEDQIYDPPEEAANAYENVLGVQITMVEGAGHSPNVEKPQQTAALILEFAANAGDEALGAGQDEFVPPNKQTAPKKKSGSGKKKNP